MAASPASRMFPSSTITVGTSDRFSVARSATRAATFKDGTIKFDEVITVPLEQDLLNGVPWLNEIRSESLSGLSSINMVFNSGTDILQARQMVQERMTQAHALPNVGSLSAKDVSLIDMSVLARWRIKPRLMGIPGVANVSTWGQRERQLQVQVDPEQLAKQNVSLTQVITTTGNALFVSPLTFLEASTPGSGGATASSPLPS